MSCKCRHPCGVSYREFENFSLSFHLTFDFHPPIHNPPKEKGLGKGFRLRKRATVSETLRNVRKRFRCSTSTRQNIFIWFPLSYRFKPTRASPVKQQLETTGWRCRWHLKNDKLRVARHGLGNTRARRTNTAKRAPNMLIHHGHCYNGWMACIAAYVDTNTLQFFESYKLVDPVLHVQVVQPYKYSHTTTLGDC